MTKSRIRIRLTSIGKIALFLSIFLMFSAQNTGNNLLFLMSSCFIAAVVFYTLASYLNLADIEARLEPPEIVFAGETAQLRCYVKDTGGREHTSLAFEGDYCPLVQPHDEVMLKTPLSPSERGVFQLADFVVFSFYPLGFCFVALCVNEQQVFVGPRPADYLPELVDREVGGIIQKFQPGKEGDYWMQKHYESGEDASLINWNISARSDSEWILTRSINYGFPEKLYFDLTGLSGRDFEFALEIVVAVAQKLRGAGSNAFIWGEQAGGQYGWLSVADNFPGLIKWLAALETGAQIPPPTGEFSGIKLFELLE